MKIIVVSDTHRRNENYFTVVQMHNPDMVIHCGDAEGAEGDFIRGLTCPVHVVLGNNDFFSDLPRELELRIGKYKVWVTHGHNYGVSISNAMIRQEALARQMDVVIYGHTHKPLVEYYGGLTIVNPGSLSYPRQDGRRPSYVIMEIDRFGEVHFTIAYL